MSTVIIRDERLRARAVEWLGKLDLSHPWEVTLRRYKANRSGPQNRLLGLWIGVIANETGNSPKAVRLYCRDEFLPRKTETAFGKTFDVLGSSAGLDTEQMTAYLNQIEAFAASWGILLPHPEDRGRVA